MEVNKIMPKISLPLPNEKMIISVENLKINIPGKLNYAKIQLGNLGKLKHAKYRYQVHIIWEGHKNLAHLPNLTLLSSIKYYKWKKSQIFLAFSQYLNFMK